MADFSDPVLLAPGRRTKQLIAVMSLLLALGVWTAVREAINQETVIYDVPIRFDMEAGYAVLDRSADRVDIKFRGSRGDLSQLKPEAIEVTLNVRDLKEERPQVTLNMLPEMVRAPGGARVISVVPASVTLSVDREGERDIPVRAEMQDRPPEGHEVEGVSCTPATVRLRGPLSKLREVTALATTPIGLEGRTRSFATRAEVLPPAHVPGARLDPDRVQVSVRIIEHAATRSWDKIPVRVMSPSGGAWISRAQLMPASVKITLQGREDVLKEITKDSIRAFVDVAALQPGDAYEVPVQWVLPQGVRVLSAEPATIRISMGSS